MTRGRMAVEGRPMEDAEVSVEPDGTIELHWPKARLTVLLSPAEAHRLTGRILDEQLTHPEAVPV